MSRTRRKATVESNAKYAPEAQTQWGRWSHRRLRRRNKDRLLKDIRRLDPSDGAEPFLNLREVSDVFNSPQDGRKWSAPIQDDRFREVYVVLNPHGDGLDALLRPKAGGKPLMWLEVDPDLRTLPHPDTHFSRRADALKALRCVRSDWWSQELFEEAARLRVLGLRIPPCPTGESMRGKFLGRSGLRRRLVTNTTPTGRKTHPKSPACFICHGHGVFWVVPQTWTEAYRHAEQKIYGRMSDEDMRDDATRPDPSKFWSLVHAFLEDQRTEYGVSSCPQIEVWLRVDDLPTDPDRRASLLRKAFASRREVCPCRRRGTPFPGRVPNDPGGKRASERRRPLWTKQDLGAGDRARSKVLTEDSTEE